MLVEVNHIGEDRYEVVLRDAAKARLESLINCKCDMRCYWLSEAIRRGLILLAGEQPGKAS